MPHTIPPMRLALTSNKLFSISLFLLLFITINLLTKNSFSQPSPIHEDQFVSINGIEQWVTIHGDSSKPAILFLHGGPGSPISPYSANLYKNWEKDFIIIQWDQRGSAKTYGRSAPDELSPTFLKANPLHLEQMVADGITLSEYLLKRLAKHKIILFGTSWGSILGIKMAAQRPDLFYAYVGHSQVVDPSNDLPLYQKVVHLAEKKGDTASLKILKTLGRPPYTEARKVGQLFRIVKKYERANSTPAPESWFALTPDYDNPSDNQHRADADDYSFVNYVGDQTLGIPSMRADIHLAKEHTRFSLPIYFIQGEEDLLTPKEVSRSYFQTIKAPVKKYYLLPKTAHGFNKAVVETQYKIFKLIRSGLPK